MIMSSELAGADKSTEIPLAEDMLETNLKYSDAEVVEDLVPEYSEADLFQLGGDNDHSK